MFDNVTLFISFFTFPFIVFFFFSSRRRHTRCGRDWSFRRVLFRSYNFFIESWVDLWSGLGVQMNVSSLEIILPVGISFYTFQTLSYTIDVYRNKLKPTSNFIQDRKSVV